jgi:PAS domain S-box-containing protein
LYINRTVPDLKREEVIGTSVFNYVPPERQRIAKDCFKRVIERGKTDNYDTEYLTKDGEVRYFDVRIGPLFQEDRVVALISSSTDVTSQKKAEEEIRSLAKFPSENPNPVLRVARDGTVLFANAAAKPILEKERSGVGKLASVIDRQWVSDVLKSGSTKEDEVKLEDKVFSFTFAPILDGGYVNIYGIDITERKKAEEYLKESEERYRQLIEFAPDAIFTYDLSGRLLDCNRQAEKLSRFKKEEIIGRNIFTTTRGRNLIKIVPGKRTEPAEYELVSRDGSKFDIEISTFPVNRKGKVEVIAIGRDLTERKKAEESLNGTMKQLTMINEKLGVVGKLTRHDVRNKLSAVVGNTYLAKKALPNDHKALDYLRNIESACSGATRVLDFAAAYETLGVEELTLVDVGRAVEEAVSLISDLKGVKVVNNCQGLTVMADSALRQLFFNLIENSLKHGKNVSQIKIYYEEGADRLKLFYEDNGVGIPKANKPKLFAEGFTTGNGSGYGLPLIKSIMKIYGWTIEEEGKPGKGARFVITIPKTHITMRARNTYL